MKVPLSQAAEIIGVHPDTLKGWGDKGPAFTRTAGGHRRYDTEVLDEWFVREHSPYPTVQHAGQSA